MKTDASWDPAKKRREANTSDNDALTSATGALPNLTWTHVAGTYDPAGRRRSTAY
jgi:hypothetical protein